MNASLAPDHSAVVQYRAVHVGMAMATPHGLVVPNVKHAQVKWAGCGAGWCYPRLPRSHSGGGRLRSSKVARGDALPPHLAHRQAWLARPCPAIRCPSHPRPFSAVHSSHLQDKTVVQIAAELARLQAAAAENKLAQVRRRPRCLGRGARSQGACAASQRLPGRAHAHGLELEPLSTPALHPPVSHVQADVSGGTFTISNIGTIGGTYATPLVNSPEVRCACCACCACCARRRARPLARRRRARRHAVPNAPSLSLPLCC